MKTFKEWQEEIDEIAADGSDLDWSKFYQFRGTSYDSLPDIEAALKPLAKRFRKDFESDDELIAAMIDAVNMAVRGPEIGSRSGSTMGFPGRFKRGVGGDNEEV